MKRKILIFILIAILILSLIIYKTNQFKPHTNFQYIPAPTNLKLGIINDPENNGKTATVPRIRIKTVYWPDGSMTKHYKCIQIPISWTMPNSITSAPSTIDSNNQTQASPFSQGYFEEIQLKIHSQQKPDWDHWTTIKGAEHCINDLNHRVWMLRPASSAYDIAITENLNPKYPTPIIAWNNNDAGHFSQEPQGDYYFRVRYFKYNPDLKTKQYSSWSNILKIKMGSI